MFEQLESIKAKNSFSIALKNELKYFKNNDVTILRMQIKLSLKIR
jgi:hypothetical protein